MLAWSKPGGCKDRLTICQKNAQKEDPDWRGNIDKVNKCFRGLDDVCNPVEDVGFKEDVGWFDIAHPAKDPTPEPCECSLVFGTMDHKLI